MSVHSSLDTSQNAQKHCKFTKKYWNRNNVYICKAQTTQSALIATVTDGLSYILQISLDKKVNRISWWTAVSFDQPVALWSIGCTQLFLSYRHASPVLRHFPKQSIFCATAECRTSVLASRNCIFKASEKLQSHFSDAVTFELILYKPYVYIQLHLQHTRSWQTITEWQFSGLA